MKKYVRIILSGVVDVEDNEELQDIVEDIVMSADMDVDNYGYEDLGKVD